MNIDMTKIWKVCMFLNIIIGIMAVLAYLLLPTFSALFNIISSGVCIWFCFIRTNPKVYSGYMRSSLILMLLTMFISSVVQQSLLTFILLMGILLFLFINDVDINK